MLAACQARPDGAELTVVGEAARLRADDALPRTTALFDGERVRLRAARGEVLGVQVVREGRGTVAIDLTLDAADDVRVEPSAVTFHDVRRPSTAMYGGSRGVGRYPDELRRVDGPVPAARAAYFDVVVARGAAAGLRHGWLTVGPRRVPVELTVEEVTLPDLGAAPRVWAYYDPRELRRGVPDTAAAPDLAAPPGAVERATAALFRAHGVLATPELTADTWPARRALVAGAAFVPVLLPREPAAIAVEVAGWIARTAGTGQVPFAIPIDEPRTIVAQLRTRVRAAWVRAGGGGAGRFLYAVTQRRGWLLGGDIDVAISPFGGDWTYNGTPPWAGAMVLDAAEPGLRTWGWIGFRHDVPLWYVWDALYWRDRYNRGRDAAPVHDLATDPITFDDGEDRGNLDGVLAYPDPAHGAVWPSLRLKALRRGLQDRALLDALVACAGRPAADRIAAALVPRSLGDVTRGDATSWPTDPAAWDAARARVLDELVACQRAPHP